MHPKSDLGCVFRVRVRGCENFHCVLEMDRYRYHELLVLQLDHLVHRGPFHDRLQLHPSANKCEQANVFVCTS